MAINNDKIVTFSDLQYLIDNENFFQRMAFDIASKKTMTKTEALNALHLRTDGEIAAYANNQLVPRRVLISTPLGYLCTTNDWTTPTPKEANSTGSWTKSDVPGDCEIALLNIGPAMNGLYALGVRGDVLGIKTPIYAEKIYPTAPGRQYTVDYTAYVNRDGTQSVRSGVYAQDISNTTPQDYSFAFTANDYDFTIQVAPINSALGLHGDYLVIDNIRIRETPVDIYPADNRASINPLPGVGSNWIDPHAYPAILVSDSGSEGIRISKITTDHVGPIYAEWEQAYTKAEYVTIRFRIRGSKLTGQTIAIAHRTVPITTDWVYHEYVMEPYNTMESVTFQILLTTLTTDPVGTWVEIDDIEFIVIPPC